MSKGLLKGSNRTCLTFIIPIRHHANSRNWHDGIRCLQSTIRSICAQDSEHWRCVVVANSNSELPQTPDRVEVVRVGFPPNAFHDLYPRQDKKPAYEAFRLDKGRRVLAGMLHAIDASHFMIVDDDDLVSRRLAGLVAANKEANGWQINDGYSWASDGQLLKRERRFSRLCGTSHVVRSDLYGLPDTAAGATDEFIKTRLGSHVQIARILADQGTPLAPLPFPGAVYRVGHTNAHSQTGGLLRSLIWNKKTVLRPWATAANLLRLRPLTDAHRTEFFGKS